MIRFMSDTRYAGLEKEMQHIPGFRPRRSGMVISHLSGCLENQRSPCERRVTDCVPFYELLEVLAEEVAVSTFVSRTVCRLTGEKKSVLFFKMVIENGFWLWERSVTEPLKKQRPVLRSIFFPQIDFCGAEHWEMLIEMGYILQKSSIHGVDLDGYVLFHMARDLYQGSSHIRLSELTDSELVSDRAFEWIMTACVIRRHGSRVLREEERSIDRSKIGQHQ